MGMFTTWLIIALVTGSLGLAVWFVQRRLPKTNRRLRRRSLTAHAATNHDLSSRDEDDDIATYWEGSHPRVEAWPEQALNDSTPDLDALTSEPHIPTRRIPSDTACRLGLQAIGPMVEQHLWLPGGRDLYSFDDLCVVENQLKTHTPTHELPNGAILASLGERATLLIEPFVEPVAHLDTFLDGLEQVIASSRLYVILGVLSEDDSASQLDAHIGAVVRRFRVPEHHLFRLQDDGSLHNHLEELRGYVPCLLNLERVPESFVREMLDYSMTRYGDGEPEATLRVLGPLADALWQRVESMDFDGVLLAEVLNLLGIVNRDVDAFQESVTCFEYAIRLLRDEGDPKDLQLVHKNLGETLLLIETPSSKDLVLATEQLRHAVQLDARDIESWHMLGQAYVARHRVDGDRSLLDRAEHALRRALDVAPTDVVVQNAILEIEDLRAHLEVRPRDPRAMVARSSLSSRPRPRPAPLQLVPPAHLEAADVEHDAVDVQVHQRVNQASGQLGS